MNARNQYLYSLIKKQGYHLLPKKEKTKLLDEYCKNTGQSRKYVIRKIRNGRYLNKSRKKRACTYDNVVKTALIRCWEIFDRPCGQRLKPLLEQETDRLIKQKELKCSKGIADKLKQIGTRTIDEKLKSHKEKERAKQIHRKKVHPLLYQKIPVKIFSEQDRTKPGNIQIDLVEHCGQTTRGEYIYTLSSTDIDLGWWEGEAVMGSSKERIQEAADRARGRYPYDWREIHSDNGAPFINAHMYDYTINENLFFSRSRPYKKNDNCLVEQKNWTHVKKFVGYLRYDTSEEQAVLNDLYRNELRLYKNFFQPVIKLVSKTRAKGKIIRKYDKPKTPYQRAMESKQVDETTKRQLKEIYLSLNPAELKRSIDKKLDLLWSVYRKKQKTVSKAKPTKKTKPRLVTSKIAHPEAVWLPN